MAYLLLIPLLSAGVGFITVTALNALSDRLSEKRQAKVETDRLLRSIEKELTGLHAEVKELRRSQHMNYSRR